MIKVLVGKKGTGKTKTLIENVNNYVNVASGDIVFISNNTRKHMYDINHRVRMVDTSEFEINDYSEFYGFICGLISNNFDISNIFIDSVLKIVGYKTDGLQQFIAGVEKLSERFNISFFLTLSIDTLDTPEYLKKYL